MSLFEQVATIARPKKFTIVFMYRSGIYDGPAYETTMTHDDLTEALSCIGISPVVRITKNY